MESSPESIEATLRQMSSGYARTQELYTTVKLGIADQLAGGPKQPGQLAQAVGANPQALYRFLRVLVARELVTQEEDGSFRLAPMGEFLRSDHPSSMHDLILYTGELTYPTGQGMLYTVQTGKPAFEHVFGLPFFDYLAQHPEVGTLFNTLLGKQIDIRTAGVVAAYDFSRGGTIVDIGGGNGTLMTAILKAFPGLRGIIFEAPVVLAEAQGYLAQNGLTERCQIVTGDFLHDPLPLGDLYILSNIIHDWDDENAVRILRNCRAAMRNNARLLLIEQIMPERVTDAPGTVGSDLSMLMLFSGAERSEAEYRHLLAQADLQLTAVIPFGPTRFPDGRKPNWAIIESRFS